MSAQFDDGKDEGALRTIGEVGKALGIKPHVLRYWEQQFPMLEPLKRSGGRRYYRTEDVELVETIDRLVNREGYTLKGARQALKEGSIVPETDKADKAPEPKAEAEDGAGVDAKETVPADIPADIIAQLKAIRGQLAGALEA